jgi:hypothetical protein
MSFASQSLMIWIYRGPSLVLSGLIALLLLRLALTLAAGGAQTFVPGLLRSATDPVGQLVRRLTPAVVPDILVLVLAAVWLMGLRLGWLYICIAGGFRPSLGG